LSGKRKVGKRGFPGQKVNDAVVRRLEDAEDLKAIREVEHECSVLWEKTKKKLGKRTGE
jgi:hypothetical protein